MKTTTATLHGAAIRPWDSPELKAIYWAGAHHALTAAIGLYGCKSIQHARRAWIDKNHRLGDHYARKVGLLK